MTAICLKHADVFENSLSLLKHEQALSNVLHVAHTSKESFMTQATSSNELN